jgi:predicted site-specific integrase-resolvase
MDGRFVTTREAKQHLGVDANTLRRWADTGLFPYIRTPGNQRLYNISKYVGTQHANKLDEPQHNGDTKRSYCYCRVSSQSQRDDLQRQIAHMQGLYPTHSILSDVGSGINFKRRGLRSLLELSSKGLVSEVVVAYRDRLCRFAFELVEWLFQLHGVKLVVLHPGLEASPRGELAEDLLAIINVFNCRVNGSRKYKAEKTASNLQERETRETAREQQSEDASPTSP